MKKRKVLTVVLLVASLCFVVSGVGSGEIKKYKEVDLEYYMDKYPEDPASGLKEWQAARDELWGLELSLVDAKVDYIMRNPTSFENVRFWYDPDGRYKVDFFEGVETEDKILVWIIDNQEIYKTMSGVALLDLFKTQLEVIYSFVYYSVFDHMGVDIVMDLDIIAKWSIS